MLNVMHNHQVTQVHLSPHCSNCQTLRDEIEYLKGELGWSRDERRHSRSIAILRSAFRLTPKEAALLLMLYDAAPAYVLSSDLEQAALHPQDNEYAPSSQIASVYVCRLRKRLGASAIDNLPHQGYALSTRGHAQVQAALAT